jgi:tRNA (mo5U34)-methyltransferase
MYRINELKPWFHNLHLPGGQQTAPEHPLGGCPSFKWKQISPPSFGRPKRVVCNRYRLQCRLLQFWACRRGATVNAIDIDSHYLEQARWAAEQFDLAQRITFK